MLVEESEVKNCSHNQ